MRKAIESGDTDLVGCQEGCLSSCTQLLLKGLVR
jgi:hypothetical protein